jgi:hypothetical protein
MIITVSKDAIASNERNNCWQTPNRRNPIRVQKTPEDTSPLYANVVDIKDAYGNTVATVVSTKDGRDIASFGTKVVIFTAHKTVCRA